MRRPHEKDFQVLRHFRLPKGSSILDVGANRGQSIRSIRLFLPVAPIVAFEPNQVVAERLKCAFRSDRNVRIESYGLGKAEQTSTLYVPYYRGVAIDSLASFRENEANWLNRETLGGFDPRHHELRPIQCPIKTIDTIGVKPSFVKIDVQGYEQDVLSGGASTIASFKPAILMENNHPEQDAKLLLRLGYMPYAYVQGRLFQGQLGDLNTLYLHPDNRSDFEESLFAR
jgi:FkbM family methyltransferase